MQKADFFRIHFCFATDFAQKSPLRVLHNLHINQMDEGWHYGRTISMSRSTFIVLMMFTLSTND